MSFSFHALSSPKGSPQVLLGVRETLHVTESSAKNQVSYRWRFNFSKGSLELICLFLNFIHEECRAWSDLPKVM